MRVSFEFDTAVEDYNTINEKIHELHRIEHMIKRSQDKVKEEVLKKAEKEYQEWVMKINGAIDVF